MSITVLAPGLLTTVQDLGRRGHAAIGVGMAGAMDPVALRLANRLVGNDDDTPALEITLSGPQLRFDVAATIAITGAPIETSLPMWRSIAIPAASRVRFGGMRRGARAYLAVAGGIGVRKTLSSASVDVNGGIGARLTAGDTLPIGATGTAHESKWSLDPAPWFDAGGDAPIRVVPGAQFERLDAASQRALFGSDFTIANDSNRVGYRLEGPALALSQPLELVSEMVAPGTVQLPPGGQPIVLMAEAPTTGGYPRIAHVATVDLPRLAQRRPGERIRFTPISLADAQKRYLERERSLAALGSTIAHRLREERLDADRRG